MTKVFEIRSKIFKSLEPRIFTEENPPSWLLGGRPGSTMDNRWFYNEWVLSLGLGETVDTDFNTIKRIA